MLTGEVQKGYIATKPYLRDKNWGQVITAIHVYCDKFDDKTVEFIKSEMWDDENKDDQILLAYILHKNGDTEGAKAAYEESLKLKGNVWPWITDELTRRMGFE